MCWPLLEEAVSLWRPLTTVIHSAAHSLPTDATAVQAFFESGLINVAGCTISTFNSSQQWDFPSSWPPTEWMMITALQNYGGEPPCLCLLVRCRLGTGTSLHLSCMAAVWAGWGLCAAAAIHGLASLQKHDLQEPAAPDSSVLAAAERGLTLQAGSCCTCWFCADVSCACQAKGAPRTDAALPLVYRHRSTFPKQGCASLQP